MFFHWPIIFLLLFLCGACWYRRQFGRRTLNWLQLAIYLLLVTALSGPEIALPRNGATVIAVVDRSLSMPEKSSGEAADLLRRISQDKKSGVKLGVVSFGSEAVLEKVPAETAFDKFQKLDISRDSSNLAGAVELALRHIPEDSAGRILVISDGEWTGRSPQDIFGKCAARNIAVDFRQLRRLCSADFGISGIDAPMQIEPGEYFTVNSRIHAPFGGEALCRIKRNNGAWQTQKVNLTPGENSVIWQDMANSPGVLDYTVEIHRADGVADEQPENNVARHITTVSGSRPLLLVSASPSGNLARPLRESGLPLIVSRPHGGMLNAARLSGCSGVVLENVAANQLGMAGMTLLADMTRTGALGLMMTGGRSSFAVGGFFKSPLADVLPVSLEQRQEMRKAALAMVVALDRSGSMAMAVGGMTKMDMANSATVEAMRQLAPGDELAVLAVDSKSHEVLPLRRLAEHKNGEERIRGIESMGGGIFTYTALLHAYEILQNSKVPTRHILLFADAADAEEPGQYQELLQKCNAEGITVSVVGLGSPGDSDAVFLRDVADRGRGMCYFSDNPAELPRIFVQDTFMVARSTFSSDPVTGKVLPSGVMLFGGNCGGEVVFGGYNLCYAKPDSEVQIVSTDEFKAPLAATGMAGLGRVSVLTAEADGEYTGAFAANPYGGTILCSLANWMRGAANNRSDYLVTQKKSGDSLLVELYLDPRRGSDPWHGNPEVHSLRHAAKGNTLTRHMLEWVTPDKLAVTVPMNGDAVFINTLSASGIRPVTLPAARQIFSPEYRFPEMRPPGSSLRELTGMTGGRECLNAEEFLRELPSIRQFVPVAPYLILAALLLFLLEVGERRLHILHFLSRRNESARGRSEVRSVTAPEVPVKASRVHRNVVKRDAALPENRVEVSTADTSGEALRQALRRARTGRSDGK